MFQNRLAPSGNAIWILGKHTVSFGASYTYTQLNTIDKRTGTGTIATDDFSQMLQGYVTPGSSSTGFYVTRSCRATPAATTAPTNSARTCRTSSRSLQRSRSPPASAMTGTADSPRSTAASSTSIPRSTATTPPRDTITNPGLIIAGNNANGTTGVSNTTLTGRQWGIAPRVGAAWQPEIFHSKVVVRAGGGMYYDRGELFSYFSPGYAIGTVTGGPFGVNQQLPFVNASSCPVAIAVLLSGLHPHLRRHSLRHSEGRP